MVFIPIVDFANHHPMAPVYGNLAEPGGHRLRALRGFFPNAKTMECFAKYGEYDAYDTYLTYGYLERNSIFVRSIPMEIDLPGLGIIKIGASTAPVMHKNLPPGMEYLKPYVPQISVDSEGKVVDAGFLLIPRQVCQSALCQVLTIIIPQLASNLRPARFAVYLEMVEEQLLSENIKFYKALQDLLEKLEPAQREKYPAQIQLAREMIRVQLAQLANYLIFRHTLTVHGAKN